MRGPRWRALVAKERETFGTVRGELDLSADSLLWAAVGLRQGTEGNRLALTSAAADGSASAYRYDNERKDNVATGEIGWRGLFHTGPVRHELSASYSAYSLDSKNAYAFSDFSGFSTDLYHPVAVAAPSADYFVGGDLDHPLTTERIATSSLALADTLVLLDNTLRVNLGARLQQLEDTTYDYTSGDESSHYAKRRLTPMLGLLYKLSPQWSAYSNYIEGLFLSSGYIYDDYWRLGLGGPPYGYHWVRYGPDLLLVEWRTGRVVDVIYGAFY